MTNPLNGQEAIIMPAHQRKAVDRGVTDPNRTLLDVGQYAMQLSRDWRERAEHHSNVRVGAVVLTMNRQGDVGFFGAANRNLREGENETKVCAEPVALQKMIVHGFTRALAIFVSGGPNQPQTQSGLTTPTMHCCGNCLSLFKHVSSVKSDTPIVSLDPEQDVYEVYSPAELNRIHARREALDEPVSAFTDPGFVTWNAARAAYRTPIEFKRSHAPGSPRPPHPTAGWLRSVLDQQG